MRRVRHFVLGQLHRRRLAGRVGVRRLRNESGSALIELALTLSLVGVPLLMGTAHFAVLLINSTVISNAAHTGAEYGMQSNTFAGDTATIITAAQDDSGMGTNLHVVPTIFFACSAAVGGPQYSTPAAANLACTGANGHPLEFIQVVASAPVTPAAHVLGLPNTVTVTSTSVMVVQE